MVSSLGGGDALFCDAILGNTGFLYSRGIAANSVSSGFCGLIGNGLKVRRSQTATVWARFGLL